MPINLRVFQRLFTIHDGPVFRDRLTSPAKRRPVRFNKVAAPASAAVVYRPLPLDRARKLEHQLVLDVRRVRSIMPVTLSINSTARRAKLEPVKKSPELLSQPAS